MVLKEVYDCFVARSPVPVMVRAALENCFGAAELDRIFAENAVQQRDGELLFSSVVDVLQLAVLQGRSSVNSAYEEKKEALGVAVRSVYNKLAGVELGVSRALVRDTSRRMVEIVEELGEIRETLPGYRVKIADGKHLDRTERRLGPLRSINGAPLPGQVIAVLDADSRLVADIIPCEDGHAQERSLLQDLGKSVEKGDLWIADRNFCTTGFLQEIADRDACFAIRRHGNLHPRPEGKLKRVGRCKTGVVYEQPISIGSQDTPLRLRRIVIELDRPTRDGDKQLTILTNLPKRVSARRVATLYRDRWTIEGAFQQIAQALNAEIKALAYPKAALLGFSLGLVAFNVLSLIKISIAATSDREVDELSSYYLADEIQANYGGMLVVLDPEFWREEFCGLTAKQMARELQRIARHVPDNRFQKTQTRSKGPPKNTEPKTNRPHVSTKRVLEEAFS